MLAQMYHTRAGPASSSCNPSDKLQDLLLLLYSFSFFQQQLDLDKDGFSFSPLFLLRLAKDGFAQGDYSQRRREIAFEEKRLY